MARIEHRQRLGRRALAPNADSTAQARMDGHPAAYLHRRAKLLLLLISITTA